MYLTGQGSADFTPDTTLYAYDGDAGSDIQKLVAGWGQNYAFSSFSDITQGVDSNAPGSGGLVFDDSTSTTTHAVVPSDSLAGEVAAVYQFDYVPGMSHFLWGDPNAYVCADDSFGSAPYFNTGGASNVINVINEGAFLIPPAEPATMGLMGLGLVGLALSRKMAIKPGINP
jgi:hypothetical protein